MTKSKETILLDDLKGKLDAIIKKGIALSKGLSDFERKQVIAKVINESIEEALENLARDMENDCCEGKMAERERKIREFIKEYSNLRIDEQLSKNRREREGR